jgi:hypothetical protein
LVIIDDRSERFMLLLNNASDPSSIVAGRAGLAEADFGLHQLQGRITRIDIGAASRSLGCAFNAPRD